MENLHKSVNENLDFQEQDPIKLNEDDDASNVGLAGTLYNVLVYFFLLFIKFQNKLYIFIFH